MCNTWTSSSNVNVCYLLVLHIYINKGRKTLCTHHKNEFPCLSPLPGLILPKVLPLTLNEYETDVRLIQKLAKPILFMIISTKFHSTLSYDMLISIFKAAYPSLRFDYRSQCIHLNPVGIIRNEAILPS
ncbi:hypothetical protein ACS0TY_011006 [Phlomoides rotata]